MRAQVYTDYRNADKGHLTKWISGGEGRMKITSLVDININLRDSACVHPHTVLPTCRHSNHKSLTPL